MNAELEADASPRGLPRIFSWPRLRFTLLAAVVFALFHIASPTPLAIWFVRTCVVSFILLLVFGVFEKWPARLPSWIARWVLQLLAVAATVPFASIFAFAVTRSGGGNFQSMMQDGVSRGDFFSLLGTALFFAPWIALGAMVRQREAFARHQALTFQLERSELERKATDARLRLLQAQVQPHFLFNTLANVRALVKAGSPQAPAVLDSLIDYLRASVPNLGDTGGKMAQELQLVRSYLELMHMRMPDRLRYAVHAEEETLDLRCPSVTLMTLVENAVRHGIDPSEEGGEIDVSVVVRDGRCIARVMDTGVGLREGGERRGTGLDTLRERMNLAFGEGNAQLRLTGIAPHGLSAELEFPAQRSTA